MSTKRKSRVASSKAPKDEIELSICAFGVDPLTITLPDPSSDMQSANIKQLILNSTAELWTYTLQNRMRWQSEDRISSKLTGKARGAFNKLGIAPSEWSKLASSKIAQISIPVDRLGQNALRLMPWEFFIASALAADPRVPIVRKAVFTQSAKPATPKRTNKNILFIQSAPGRLGTAYDFDSEKKLVRSTFSDATVKILENPDIAEIRRYVVDLDPEVIHFAGFDYRQAMAELSADAAGEYPSAIPRVGAWPEDSFDGVVLGDPAQGVVAHHSAEFADALCAGKRGPVMVCLACWHGATALAPELVLAGARSCFCFQDILDDEFAETILSSFYRFWRDENWQLGPAFTNTLRHLWKQPGGVRGTGIVLLTTDELVARETPESEPPKTEAAPPLRGKKLADANLPALIGFDIRPHNELNYAMLHNAQPLFKSFRIIRLSDAEFEDLEITVDLCTGPEGKAFRRTTALRVQTLDLTREIVIPLNATLSRQIREAVSSSLFVEIACGGRILHRETHRVRLLPADQWKDSAKDSRWLPSFVLPRDPAVTHVIRDAHKYVKVLRDDPDAGFEGYQVYSSIDDESEHSEDEQIALDLQVQAIWAAIAHECRLVYINPPPTYSDGFDSQRLRTPSTTVNGQMGTCIDLALLFAACLEFVDIYPVIFLLDGHALPGYWRSETAHNRFVCIDNPGDAAVRQSRSSALAGGAKLGDGWVFDESIYEEIRKEIEIGNLVPVESTRLTQVSSFAQAVELGTRALASASGFQCMLDIHIARQLNVTPLPIQE